MGYIFARLIYKGLKTIDDVPERYVEVTLKAYRTLYGIDLGV